MRYCENRERNPLDGEFLFLAPQICSPLVFCPTNAFTVTKTLPVGDDQSMLMILKRYSFSTPSTVQGMNFVATPNIGNLMY